MSLTARTVETTYLMPSTIQQLIARAYGTAMRPAPRPLPVHNIVPRAEARGYRTSWG